MVNKVVIITEYFYPATRNDAYLITKIAETFSESNMVDVICTSKLETVQELQTISGNILRLNRRTSSDSNILRRIAKLMYITGLLFFKSLFIIRKQDQVFSVTNPAFFLPLLICIKKIKKFKLTLLVFDIFPENLIAIKALRSQSLMYKILLKIYNWAYEEVDRFVVIGRDMEEVINKKTKIKKSIIYIPNWCNLTAIQPFPKADNGIIQKYKLEDKIVFSFVGNFGLVQNIENILNAILEVKSEEFTFLFIGDGAMKNTILSFINNFNCKNIIYAGKFPPELQNEFLNACDIAVMSLDENMYGLGVPSKTYYNMAAEKPLLYIGHKNSEVAKLIEEFEIGWVVEPNNSQKLAQMIDFLCANAEQFRSKAKKARQVALTHYSEDIILSMYKQLY